jgi:peptidyl-prolyl cis-trans isomerase C
MRRPSPIKGISMLRTPSPFAKSRPILLALALALPMVAQAADAPKAPDAPKDPVVAKVNATTIHFSDVIAAQRALSPQYQSAPLQQIYPQLVQQLVDNKLVADAAKTAKIGDDPDYKAQLAKEQEQLMANFYMRQLVIKARSDEALHAYYDKWVKDQPAVDEVHARHILVATEDEAKAIVADLDKGGDFTKLANEKTTDKSGSKDGGDLGWLSKEHLVPEFANAAFALKKGEYTKTPVKTQFGYHVILVEDTRKAPPSFDESKADLAKQLAMNTVQVKLDELRKKAKIEEFNPDGSPLAPPPKPEAKPDAKPEAKPDAKPAAKP